MRLSAPDGHERDITWQHVKIEFPILSTAALTEDLEHESDIMYSKDGGKVIELKGEKISKFVRHGSAYFMKMFLRKRDLHKQSKPDFVRPGMGA